MSITDQDIIEYGQNHLFAYTDYQIQNYVINTGITDHRKTRQALLEIEQRTNSLIDLDFLIRKHHANIEIKKEELAAETGTAKK